MSGETIEEAGTAQQQVDNKKETVIKHGKQETIIENGKESLIELRKIYIAREQELKTKHEVNNNNNNVLMSAFDNLDCQVSFLF